MPVGDGREPARTLHQTRPEIPVIFTSGYAGPQMTDQGLLDPDVTPFTKSQLRPPSAP